MAYIGVEIFATYIILLEMRAIVLACKSIDGHRIFLVSTFLVE